jgi:hypothetical protein
MWGINSEAAAKAVTVPQLLTATACLSMDCREAAQYYCRGLALVALHGDASCADVIMSAGCIPHVIDCLRRWPADGSVVYSACSALALLAKKGSASVHTAIKGVPGIQATLQASKASGLDDGYAARAFSALGFLVRVCARGCLSVCACWHACYFCVCMCMCVCLHVYELFGCVHVYTSIPCVCISVIVRL